jgi:hypothetical protein
MRTTNMLERQDQELKRRTRVVWIFPHDQSCPRLIAAPLMESAQEWMGRIYLSMEQLVNSVTEATAAAGVAGSLRATPSASPQLNQHKHEPTTFRKINTTELIRLDCFYLVGMIGPTSIKACSANQMPYFRIDSHPFQFCPKGNIISGTRRGARIL